MDHVFIDKAFQTQTRWRYALAIVIVLGATLLGGTYINARWGGPTSITMSLDGTEATPDEPPRRTEKDVEKGNGNI